MPPTLPPLPPPSYADATPLEFSDAPRDAVYFAAAFAMRCFALLATTFTLRH